MSRRSNSSTWPENLAAGKRDRRVVYDDMVMWRKKGYVPNSEGMIEHILAVERV